MLIRDVLHPHSNTGRIAIHRLNAMVFINEDGVIDAEKARKLKRDIPKASASDICAHLLRSTRYQQFKLKQPKVPTAVAAPPPAPAAAPALATPPASSAAVAPATTEAPAATTEGSEADAPQTEGAPPEGGNGEGGLPATQQGDDPDLKNTINLKTVLAAKSVTELFVVDVTSALATGHVPKEKAMSWFAQESARKPKKKQRKSLLLALRRHIKEAA